MDLDMRTLLLLSSLLNATFTLYLFIVWVNHKDDFNGILLFVLGMAAITLGTLGLGYQGIIPPFFSIVVSNTFNIGGLVLIYISLRQFFGLKTSRFLSICLFFIPAVSFVEQFIFGIIVPNFMVRMFSIAILMAIPLGLITIMLIKFRKKTSLPGILLTITFIVQFLLFLIRIPVTLTATAIGSILNMGDFYVISMVILTLTSCAWPIGFTLLISFQLHEREQIRSREKTILLQELYHRTKNNMQVIRSMLMLQAAKYSNEQIQELVQDTGNRIQTMALVHQMLYQSKDLSNINVKDYIGQLSEQIFQSYQDSSHKISFVLKIEEISLLIDTAIPLGLVLNELISNSLKYAFPGEQKGKITIKISRKSSKKIELYFFDNGVGVSDEFDFSKQKTLGIKMIKGIVEQQMDGVVRFEKTKGLTCHIEFSDTLYEERI